LENNLGIIKMKTTKKLPPKILVHCVLNFLGWPFLMLGQIAKIWKEGKLRNLTNWKLIFPKLRPFFGSPSFPQRDHPTLGWLIITPL